MTYTPSRFTYIGIDEGSLGIGKDSRIVVAAATRKKKLTKAYAHDSLKKSKDLLLDYARHMVLHTGDQPPFPSLESMTENGVDNFHWTRSRGGRFSQQMMEHASIAHVVSTNGYSPQRTVLLIDAFHTKHEISKYLITEFLKKRDFPLPRKNIEIVEQGDRRVPIINYADLLAFQIGIHLNDRNKDQSGLGIDMPLEAHEIPYDEQRVFPIPEEDRDKLESIITSWKGKRLR